MPVLFAIFAGAASGVGFALYHYFKEVWGLSVYPSWRSFIAFGIMQIIAIVLLATACSYD